MQVNRTKSRLAKRNAAWRSKSCRNEANFGLATSKALLITDKQPENQAAPSKIKRRLLLSRRRSNNAALAAVRAEEPNCCHQQRPVHEKK
jgi:hypothetical protein